MARSVSHAFAEFSDDEGADYDYYEETVDAAGHDARSVAHKGRDSFAYDSRVDGDAAARGVAAAALAGLYNTSDTDSDDDGTPRAVNWAGKANKAKKSLIEFKPISDGRDMHREVKAKAHPSGIRLAFKMKSDCRLVRDTFIAHGFREVGANSDDFNVLWTGSHVKPFALRQLTEHQRVNHFPRSFEITRKDRLYKSIQRMQQVHGKRHFGFLPTSFLLPSEYNEFYGEYLRDRGPWIVKPVNSSRGRGIYLVNHVEQIPSDELLVVSRYIENPLLVDGFKFDLRLYVVVTSFDPLRIYLYDEGLARFATERYDKSVRTLSNSFMHLTNYSINKNSDKYVASNDPDLDDYGNKWSLSALLRYLREKDCDTATLMLRIEDIINKTILSGEVAIASACKMFVPHRNNCFELYGFDVLVDDQLKPWLLEVNLSPSLACDAPLDMRIKSKMISDMMTLVGIPAFDATALREQKRKQHMDALVKNAMGPSRKSHPMSGMFGASARSSSPSGGRHVPGQRPKQRPETPECKKGSRDVGLSPGSRKVLADTIAEEKRRGGFVRIFPTEDTWPNYSGFLEDRSGSLNAMLNERLFPNGRPTTSRALGLAINGATGMAPVSVTAFERVRQYEKRSDAGTAAAGPSSAYRRAQSAPAGSRQAATETVASRHASEDAVQCDVRVSSFDNMASMERLDEIASRDGAHASGKGAAGEGAVPPGQEKAGRDRAHSARGSRPKSSSAAQQPQQVFGRHLRPMQAREAFSTYLERVQHRLEETAAQSTGMAAVQSRGEDQLVLIGRFLQRAAANMGGGSFRVVIPSSRLPMDERQILLARQLAEFVRLYRRDSERLAQRQEQFDRIVKTRGRTPSACHDAAMMPPQGHGAGGADSVSDAVFAVYLSDASEADLEEVLSDFTKHNKGPGIFSGDASAESVPVVAQVASSRVKSAPATTLRGRAGLSVAAVAAVASGLDVRRGVHTEGHAGDAWDAAEDDISIEDDDGDGSSIESDHMYDARVGSLRSSLRNPSKSAPSVRVQISDKVTTNDPRRPREKGTPASSKMPSNTYTRGSSAGQSLYTGNIGSAAAQRASHGLSHSQSAGAHGRTRVNSGTGANRAPSAETTATTPLRRPISAVRGSSMRAGEGVASKASPYSGAPYKMVTTQVALGSQRPQKTIIQGWNSDVDRLLGMRT